MKFSFKGWKEFLKEVTIVALERILRRLNGKKTSANSG